MKRRTDIDLELVFDRRLGVEELGSLQQLLADRAPLWSSSLEVWAHRNDHRQVNIEAVGSLAEEVVSAAAWRGETYRQRVAESGQGDGRFLGSVELHGCSPALTVVISLDSKPLFRMRDGSLLFGNRIAFQIRDARIDGLSNAAWARKLLEIAAARLRPVWASARTSAEYRAKVMSDLPPHRAEGRDFSEYLPGLFWLNYVGEPYVDLIGLDRLLSAPAEVLQINQGVFLALPGDPWAWEGEEYRKAEDAVLSHVGKEFFFSKVDSGKTTVAPRWPPG
jgi:hypothetical protein